MARRAEIKRDSRYLRARSYVADDPHDCYPPSHHLTSVCLLRRSNELSSPLLTFPVSIFDRCRGGSSRGGCSTVAEAAGTAQAPITSSSPSNSSSNTGSNFRRPSTFPRPDQQSRPQPQRRSIITLSPLRPRPHGTFDIRGIYYAITLSALSLSIL